MEGNEKRDEKEGKGAIFYGPIPNRLKVLLSLAGVKENINALLVFYLYH